MNENTKICLGCMKEISQNSTVCEHCGFNPDKYQANPRCLRLGTELAGKYVIGKVIGEGGFGITYIGWDLILELPVAIKEYFPPKIASRDTTSGNNTIYMFDDADEKSFDEGMKRCVKEAKNMSKLESLQGIVSIRDFFYANKTAYIIMEYVDGITLKKYLEKNGKMPVEDVLDIMKPIMLALEQMHEQKIIHRDISPDNIMIRKDGQVKLIDFGAARVAQEEDEKSLTVMLKRGFSPEEQYRSKGHQGTWTDVYALCATLYYMLTGIIPPEAMERVLEDTYIPINEVKNIKLPDRVAFAINKGLNVRAKDRIQTITELLDGIYGEREKILDISGQSDNVVISDVGETILDNDNTILMEDAEELTFRGDENRTHKFGIGKKKIILFALIGLSLLGGGVTIFLTRNKGREVQKTISEEKTANITDIPATPMATETVTTSAVSATMFNTVGMQLEEAKSQLVALDNAININVAEEYSSTVAKNVIIRQDKAEGTAWIPEKDAMQITLVVSKGKEMISVPNVKGKSKTAAVKELGNVGLKTKISQSYSSSVKKGCVISQSHKPSSMTEIKSQIKLVISKGAKPTPTPKPTPAPTPKSTPKPTRKPKKDKDDDTLNIIGDEVLID